MALKQYEYNGSTFQFEESEAPEGAVEVKASQPESKSSQPANKSRAPRNKGA